MRSSLRLMMALFVLMATSGSFAQYSDVDPRALPAQVAAQEVVVGSGQGSGDWQAWLKLAVLLQDSGKYRESEDAYRRTIELLRAPDPLTVADVFDHMGTMYVQSGQFSKADPVERHALAIREHEQDKLGSGVSHMHVAMLLLGEKELPAAEAEAQTAVALLVPEYSHSADVSSATPEEKMTALIDLAEVQNASGENDNAIPLLRFALQIAHKNYADDSLPVGTIDFLLGQAYWKSGDFKEASVLMSHGVHTLSTEIGWGHPMYLTTLRNYEAFLVATNQRSEAKQVAKEIERLDSSTGTFAVAAGPEFPK